MKKTIVVNVEYMKPSAGRRGRSRSRSRSQPRTRSQGKSQSPSRSRSHSRSSVNRIITSAIEKSALCDEYEFDEELDMNAMLNNSDPEYDASDSINDSYDTSDNDGETSDDNDDESTTSYSETTKHYEHPSVKDTDYAVNSDDDLLQSVLDEPTFPLDVNAILSAMTKTENSTIANMTLKQIAERRHEILSSMNLTPEKMEEFERKLHMYRVIEDPSELKHNQLIRWIPLRSLETRPYVTLGGCLFRVKYNEEESVHIVTLRNVKRFVFNIKFELNAVFQRLSQEELLILRAVEYVESPDDVQE